MQSIFILLFSFCCFQAFAQDAGKVKNYEAAIAGAGSDEDKIGAIVSLAHYYAVFHLETQADSLTHKALTVAETSTDSNLVFKILFQNDINLINIWSSEATINKSMQFIKKGLALAHDRGREDYEAIGNIKLARLYRLQGQYDDALQHATEAFTNLDNLPQDSLKSLLYIELGDIYKSKGEAVPAYKNYNNAFDVAYKMKSVGLQSDIYHRYADLYRLFGDDESAKKYLITSLRLNVEHGNEQGLYNDYIDLARITDEEDYIVKAEGLANKLQSDRYRLAVKRLRYYLLMTKGKVAENTFQFLFKNKDLWNYFKNMGPVNCFWQYGNIYHYGGQYPEALHYFSLAEKALQNDNDADMSLLLYKAMGEAYLMHGDSANATHYYEKSFELARQLNQLNELPDISKKLGMLHAAAQKYATAYLYALEVDSANKILQANAAKDKVALLQIDRENSNRQTDLTELARETSRRRNLQVMFITIAITGIFGFMLFLGLFAVSKNTIRVTGYFAFISLFEFIILLIDYPLHNITHGEPLKIWSIKIAIIALLVPIQNFLEHRLIAFLESRKLLEARQRFSLKNWWIRLKKAASKKESGPEPEVNVL